MSRPKKTKDSTGYYKSSRFVSKDGKIIGIEHVIVHPEDGEVFVITKEMAEEIDKKHREKEGSWATEYLYRMHHKNDLGNLKRRGLQGNTPQEVYDKVMAEHPEYRKEWDEAGITRENEVWGLDDQATQDRRLYFVRRPNIPYVGHLKLRVKKDIADEHLDAYLEEDKGLPKEFFYDSGRVIPPEHIQVRSGKKWVPVTEYEYNERKKKGEWAGKKPWEMTKDEYNKYRGVVYHQTSKDNAQKIEQEGFKLDYPLARRGDDRMPDAVFFKPTTADIGVGAMEESDRAQIDAYVKKGNVEEFATTEKLRDYLEQDPQYKELYYQSWLDDRRIAKEMNKLSDEYFSGERRHKSPEEHKEFESKFDALKEQAYIAPTKARERATAYLKEQGVDTVIVKDDVGSFGRRVTTVAALDPKKIKPYLHKQVVREAMKRGKSVPDSVLKDYADLYEGKKKGAWAQKRAYHGSRGAVNVSELKTVNDSFNFMGFTNVPTVRHGVFLTDNPKFAKSYGDNVMEVGIETKKLADLDNDYLQSKFVESLDPYKERDLWIQASNTRKPWLLFENELGKRFKHYLQDKGYKGAKFVEYTVDDNDKELKGNTYVVFDNSDLNTYTRKDKSGTWAVKYAPMPLQRSARPHKKVKGHSTRVGRVR